MKEDRFLTGILIGIGVLVIVALGVYFVQDRDITYLPDDTPEGVVHNFILAIQLEEYERAYGYFAEWDRKPSYAEFISGMSICGSECSGVGVQILDVSIYENSDGSRGAIVDLSIRQPGSGPFDSGYTREDNAELVEQSGEWRIIYMPYPFWSWSWDQLDYQRYP